MLHLDTCRTAASAFRLSPLELSTENNAGILEAIRIAWAAVNSPVAVLVQHYFMRLFANSHLNSAKALHDSERESPVSQRGGGTSGNVSSHL